MASEVGSAYVTLIPSAKGFASKMQAELAGDVAKIGKGVGSEVGEAVGDEGGKVASSRFSDTFKKGLGKVAALAGGLAIGATLGKGISDALGAGAMTAKLQAQLGLTEKQSERAGKVAGTLFGDNYGDSMEQVNEAIRSVVQNIDGMRGASEATLGRISTKALNTANIFDQDLGATTRAVSQMMRTGLAKDADHAFDILTKGFQSGADKSEDFLDTLNEYGTQFRKLGLDGETATGLISQGLKAGARDGDTVADALKEFAIRAKDGSKASAAGFDALGLSAEKMTAKIGKGGKGASDGLQLVLDRLRGMKDPVKQEAAAVALFGTKAEDMGTALYKLDPSKAVQGLGKVGGAADKANKAFNDTPTARVQAFVRELQQGLTNAMSSYVIPAIDALTPALATLGAKLSNVAGFVKSATGFLKEHSTIVGVVAGAIVALTVVTQLHALALAISSGALKAWVVQTRIVSAATKAWAAVQWLLNAAMSANPLGLALIALAAVGVALAIAWRKSETFRAVVTKAFDAVKSTASKVFSWLSNAVGSVIDWVRKNWVKLVMILGGPLGLAFGLVKGHWDSIKKATTAAWEAVKAAVSKALGAVVGFVKGLGSSISGGISSAWNTAKSITANLWEGIKGAVTGGIAKVVGVVQGLKGKVTGALSGAGTWLTGIGRNIIEGLGAGIESMYQWVRDKVDALSGWIPGWVKKKLGIASPSKVMAKLGEWIGKGLAGGISKSSADVGSALGELNKQINARLDAAFDGKKLRNKTAEVQKALKKRSDKLREHGRSWDELAAKITGAQETLDKVASYAGPIKDAVVAMGNLVGLGSREVTTGAGTDAEKTVTQITASTILDDLRAQAAEAAEFQSIMAGLRSSGLNQTTLDQLYQAGPEAALATAQALSQGGAAAIGEVNSLATQLSSTAVTVADQAAESMHGIGWTAAQNLVSGFIADQATLETQAANLVSQLVEAVKKATKDVGIDLDLSVDKHKPKKGKGKKGSNTKLASGGRVTGATVALIGEGREPETVLPDSLLRGLLERTAAQAAGPGGVSEVRVFIGERELTDLVRVEVNGAQVTQARQLAYGRRA
jgi:phage-related minor tail protein